MNKSTSPKIFSFFAFALVFGVFAVHGQIYAIGTYEKNQQMIKLL